MAPVATADPTADRILDPAVAPAVTTASRREAPELMPPA